MGIIGELARFVLGLTRCACTWLQTQLRSAESSGPRVRFDEGGREYTDSGSAKALVVPKKLVRNGLPPEQRGEIWQVMSGSAAKRSSGRGQYNSLVRRYARRQSAATQQIDRDLSRTFPDNTVYQSSVCDIPIAKSA